MYTDSDSSTSESKDVARDWALLQLTDLSPKMMVELIPEGRPFGSWASVGLDGEKRRAVNTGTWWRPSLVIFSPSWHKKQLATKGTIPTHYEYPLVLQYVSSAGWKINFPVPSIHPGSRVAPHGPLLLEQGSLAAARVG